MSEELEFVWPLIGHERVKSFLQSGVKQRRLAQAYLFYGPEKIGKTTLARYLAKTVFCDSFREYNKLSNILVNSATPQILPCGRCESCLKFEKGVHTEFYQLERELNEKTGEKRQNITISQIRELQGKLNKRSFANSYKVAIVKEAGTLTKEASNALLKTLEEPTPYTILILTTTSRELILETIQSRCQSLQFLPVKKKEIYDYLLTAGMDKRTVEEVSLLAQGRPTVALKALEQIETIKEQSEKGKEWLSLLEQNNSARLKAAEQMMKKKPTAEAVSKELTLFSLIIRDLCLLKIDHPELVMFRSLMPLMQGVAQKKLDGELSGLLQRVERAKIQLKQNVNSRLILENLFLNI